MLLLVYIDVDERTRKSVGKQNFPEENIMSERVYGIDVSSYKPQVYWHRVKNESAAQFAITRASQGDYFSDNLFHNHWSGIRSVGLVRGVYHFFSPRIDPIRQANHFLRIIDNKLYPGDLPPILDIEWYPPYIQAEWARYSIPERIERIQICLDRIERDTGKTPMIYTSANSWREVTGNSRAFTRYPLWVAHYNRTIENPWMPANNWGGNHWKFWQFSETGRVTGVGGLHENVDENWFKGTLQELYEFADGKVSPVGKLFQLTNGEVYAAFQTVANRLVINLNRLLNKAGMRYIVDEEQHHLRYDGRLLTEMELEEQERLTLDEEIDAIIAQKLSDTFPPGYTHQDVIQVFYAVAEELMLDGWTLIEMAGLEELAIDRSAFYQGPSISQLRLNDDAKKRIKLAVGIIVVSGDQMQIPYPLLTNQKMINAFYRAAPPTENEYWRWIERAELTFMAIPNTNRNLFYSGPKIEDLSGLSQGEKDALLAVLFS